MMGRIETGTKHIAGAAEVVDFRYFGHSAFLLTAASGARVLIDPFGNPSDPRTFPSYGSSEAHWFSKPFPRTECDVVLVTHPHFDHDAVHRVPGLPTIVRAPLELKGCDYLIRGFMGRHAGQYGKEFGQRNVVFVVETAGVAFCHIGDNRAGLPEGMGRVDVLMVPVDETNHLLTYEEVDRLISLLDPAVVVPTHYRIPGLTDPACPLGGIEGWLSRCPNVRRVSSGCTKLSPSDLPEEREVWVFENPGTTIPRSAV